ncbi:hypothetical protein GCM10027511_38520 [Hymenobacter humi]
MKMKVLGLIKHDEILPNSAKFFAMKSAANYLEAHVFEARRPRRELQPVVAYSDAVHAIEQALADAEKYKYLLMRALRRHADGTKPVSPPARLSDISHSFPLTGADAPVLPLYPSMAA